jgi:hypothetical protein
VLAAKPGASLVPVGAVVPALPLSLAPAPSQRPALTVNELKQYFRS